MYTEMVKNEVLEASLVVIDVLFRNFHSMTGEADIFELQL